MKETVKPNSLISGCHTVVWTIVFFGALLFSAFIIQPVAVELIAPSFCDGKIAYERRGSIICVDKKTGERKYISHIQIFACCPSAGLMIFLLMALLISSAVLRKSEQARERKVFPKRE